jgi:hypothetical protein
VERVGKPDSVADRRDIEPGSLQEFACPGNAPSIQVLHWANTEFLPE